MSSKGFARRIWVPLAFVAALSAICATVSSSVDAAARANVILSHKLSIPADLTSEAKLLKFFKSNEARTLQEVPGEKLDDGLWRAQVLTRFAGPLNDFEYHLIFNEIDGSSKRFLEDMAVTTTNKKERTYVQKITLKRPKFRPNKNIELLVTVRGQTVGQAIFRIVGKEDPNRGKVDFSAEET